MLAEICNKLDIASQPYDTEHFFTTREELSVFFTEKKTFLMESFYRHMRLKHQILVDGANRAAANGITTTTTAVRSKAKSPSHLLKFSRDVSGIVSEIAAAGIKTFGSIAPTAFDWPTSREESLEILKHFCLNLLEHFGDYQDAMAINHPFLFHSRLSFAMNTKMISPKEVVKTILNYYEKFNREIKLPEVEGFIRQILGWREYMRGMYWMRMPEFAAQNALQHQQPLPVGSGTATPK
jgi:deoxyribodipyrimidine photolyase-related protein